MKSTADVVITGAGVIGLALARALARAGMDVLVIERAYPGAGASSAAAGMLTAVPEGAVFEPFLQLCRQSLEQYRAWCEELREATGIDPEYRDEGSLLVACSEVEARLLAATLDSYRRAGLVVEVLSRDEARRREPLFSQQCRGALFLAGDHQVNTRRLVEALRIATEASGVSVVSATDVRAVRVERDRVVGVMTAHGSVAAPWAVIAAGAWSAALSSHAAIASIPVRPVKGEIVCLVMQGRMLRHIVHGTDCYLVPRRDGRLLVGATEVDGTFDMAVSAGAVHHLLSAAARVVPAVLEWPIANLWAGLRPTAPDRLPLLGPAGPDGLLIATGHYRKGILLAPETARLLAETIVSGRVSAALAPFDLARFTPRTSGSALHATGT